MLKLLDVKPRCIDCGTTTSLKVHDSEVWTMTDRGWLCNTCWQDSWDNDSDTKQDAIAWMKAEMERMSKMYQDN